MWLQLAVQRPRPSEVHVTCKKALVLYPSVQRNKTRTYSGVFFNDNIDIIHFKLKLEVSLELQLFANKVLCDMVTFHRDKLFGSFCCKSWVTTKHYSFLGMQDSCQFLTCSHVVIFTLVDQVQNKVALPLISQPTRVYVKQ